MANQSNCSQSDMYPTTGESGSSKVSTSRLQALSSGWLHIPIPVYCCLFTLRLQLLTGTNFFANFEGSGFSEY